MTGLQSTVHIKDGVLSREVAGESVLLDMTSGTYFGLDPVGTRMWSLLAEHKRLEPVYQVLAEEFDVTEDQLLGDLTRLVDELASRGLLEIHDQ